MSQNVWSKRQGSCLRGAAAFTALLAGLLAPEAARAQPTIKCYDPLDRPNVVYVAGSSAVKSFLSVVAGLLANESPTYTIVYQAQGSCTGARRLASN